MTLLSFENFNTSKLYLLSTSIYSSVPSRSNNPIGKSVLFTRSRSSKYVLTRTLCQTFPKLKTLILCSSTIRNHKSIALSSSEKEIHSKISYTPEEQKQNATARNDYSAQRKKPLETSAHDARTSFSFGCTTRHGRPRTREICRKIGVWSACVPFRNREKLCCVQWYVRACERACVSK